MKKAAAVRVGSWRVWLADGGGTSAASEWLGIVERVTSGSQLVHRSRHADTYRWSTPDGEVYVKVYRRHRCIDGIKDTLRGSKARNVVRVSARLAALGFCVPRVLAAGERRVGPLVQRAWVATAAVAGQPIGDRMAVFGLEATARMAPEPRRACGRRESNRELLGAVGKEVARLHLAGFVAGELVPANVWVGWESEGARIVFFDHDRTRFHRSPAPWRRARRNLVELNRGAPSTVGTSERLRVFRAYCAARGWSRRTARRHLRWIIGKTHRVLAQARRRAARRSVPLAPR